MTIFIRYFVTYCITLTLALLIPHAVQAQVKNQAIALGPGSSDLGVRFISRAPLYWRYNVDYDEGLPKLIATHGDLDPTKDQHWPLPGEKVTFTAHIRNNSPAAVNTFEYLWYIDGRAQSTSPQVYSKPLEAGQEATVDCDWTWPASLTDHKVKIIIDPNRRLKDDFRKNNIYEDYTNALSIHVWVEEGFFYQFNRVKNGFGTYSFDDWFRWQLDTLKECLRRSQYPLIAVGGVPERVRLDSINVVPFDDRNLLNFKKYLAYDEQLYLNDARWQFIFEDYNLPQKAAKWNDYIRKYATNTDWELVRGLSHELGVIEEYNMNLSPAGNQVRMLDGKTLSTIHFFNRPGIMGGAYVLPGYEPGKYYSDHSAGAFTQDLHKRRGYFGAYLFDIPRSNYLAIHDINNKPLANATVNIYQKGDRGIISDDPVITAKTNSQGLCLLTNRPAPAITTETGHTLHPNPFGKISVVGDRATFLVKVSYRKQEDFRWLEIIQFNKAYWAGQKDSATYPLRTDIDPSYELIASKNLALNKPARASHDFQHASYANDGDIATADRSWRPDPPKKGEWWDVDLGSSHRVCRVEIYPAPLLPLKWFKAFHFEVSETGKFAGEQHTLPAETNWELRLNNGNYALQMLSGFQRKCVYTFKPIPARFFRVVADVDCPGAQLQELAVYEAK